MNATEYAEILRRGGWKAGIPLPPGVPYPWEVYHHEQDEALSEAARKAARLTALDTPGAKGE